MNNIRKNIIFTIFISLLVLSMFLYFGINKYTSADPNVSQIHFISIGSSNSALIESNGHYGLVDTGNPYDLYSTSSLPSGCSNYDVSGNNVYEKVIPYLQALGVSSLDFVIITHAHSDHIGGVTKLIDKGYIDSNTIYYYKKFQGVSTSSTSRTIGEPTTWCTKWIYDKTMDKVNQLYADKPENKCDVTTKVINTNGASTDVVSKCRGSNFNQIINFYDYKIKLFNTESTVNTNNENNNSLGVLITYDNRIKTFIAGDINNIDLDENKLSKNSELKNVDIFMAGHHGNPQSNSVSYIRNLNPEYTVISNANISGDTSVFYGPYRILKNQSKKVYATYNNNSAIVFTMGNNLTVNSGVRSNGSLSYTSQINDFKYTSSVGSGWWYWYLGSDYVTEKGKSSDAYMYFNSSGKFLTGWQQINGRYYYFDQDGVTSNGFKTINGKTYYFATYDDKQDDSSKIQASMLTGWQNLRDPNNSYKKNYYYFDGNGVMLTGWQTISSKQYYFSNDGKMLSNTCKIIDSNKCCFDSSGVLTSKTSFQSDIGDINGDEKINITDVSMLYRYIKGVIPLTDIQKSTGDVTQDGKIKMDDVSKLYRYVKKIITSLN